jgi:hypothetical protein
MAVDGESDAPSLSAWDPTLLFQIKESKNLAFRKKRLKGGV